MVLAQDLLQDYSWLGLHSSEGSIRTGESTLKLTFLVVCRLQFLACCWTEVPSCLPHGLLCKATHNMAVDFPENERSKREAGGQEEREPKRKAAAFL